jgi:hypothetical protein
MTVSGEWNGVLVAKYPASGKQEVFVDTKQIPIIKKKVAQIDDQEEHESRFLWKDLTLALKIHDVNLANATKSNIEQQQRDLVEERRDAGCEWQQRVSCTLYLFLLHLRIKCSDRFPFSLSVNKMQHFHQNAGTWMYKKPLTERINSKKLSL